MYSFNRRGTAHINYELLGYVSLVLLLEYGSQLAKVRYKRKSKKWVFMVTLNTHKKSCMTWLSNGVVAIWWSEVECKADTPPNWTLDTAQWPVFIPYWHLVKNIIMIDFFLNFIVSFEG